MNVLWWLSRKLYLLGLVPVVPLFLVAVNDPNSDIEVTQLVKGASVAYFCLGVLLLVVFPKRLRSRLFERVDKYKTSGFTPRWEAVSILFNRYLGFDEHTGRVLYVDVNDGTEKVIHFCEVTEWEVDDDNKQTSLLKLLTRVPALPVIGVRIDRRLRDVCRAQLNAILR